MLKIISTSDGSDTLYVQELDEHYHSTFGAVKESNHVFIESGYKSISSNPVRIFELGFGTGLNTFLTLLESLKDKRMVYYVSIEKYPLPANIYKKLNYSTLYRENEGSYYNLIHECSWGIPREITDNFSLLKIEKDFMEMDTDMVFDIVYFDAFAPEKQPEMWSYNVLELVASLMNPGGVFVTYSAKGQLKRDLKQLGFLVENPAGPPGKRQITRAVKKS
ncbi:MAG: tRNA (5-methylaminomethyl-2-thiouridine)(34)-methyltransferase MnmD [Bacteroidales bacterium]|nr:tRNA (5-methylaminomethyl-2-thiouridine)(34)-methyltransferase MnmD [Bacteroidales bacterium]